MYCQKKLDLDFETSSFLKSQHSAFSFSQFLMSIHQIVDISSSKPSNQKSEYIYDFRAIHGRRMFDGHVMLILR